MTAEKPSPEINMSQIQFGGGIAGLIFTVGSMLIFLLGVPVLWYFFAFAMALGGAFAAVIVWSRRVRPQPLTVLEVDEHGQK